LAVTYRFREEEVEKLASELIKMGWSLPVNVVESPILRRILEIEEERYATEFGRYIDAYDYDIVLKPNENKLLFEGIGVGKLVETIASITMPDETPPEVQFEVLFDDNLILDWTCEEYYTLLGFRPVPGYGGCTIYDTTLKKYAWWTHWGPFGNFKSLIRVWLHNLTDVEVTVDVWDVQLRLIGKYSVPKG
jgi:hypothetical protein